MAYLQVKDLLVHAEHLRKFVHSYAERHQRGAEDDLLAALFDEMKKHDEQLIGVLAEYQNSDSQDVVETWLQFPGISAVEEAMDQLATVDQQDEQVVIQEILSAEQSLYDMYDQAQRQTNAPRLQTLFQELKELQDHHLRNVAACASEFQQQRRL